MLFDCPLAHKVSEEACSHSYLLFLLSNMSSLWLLLRCSFYYSVSKLTLKCLVDVRLWCVCLAFCWASWICGFIIIQFARFTAIISLNVFSVPFPSTQTSCVLDWVLLSHRALQLDLSFFVLSFLLDRFFFLQCL